MGKPGRALSRSGLFCGSLACIAVVVALISGSWLYTDEPIFTNNSTRLSFSLGITIGLWTVCPFMKKVNTTIHFTSPTCSLIKYKKLDYEEYLNLEKISTLQLAQLIVLRIRSCIVWTTSAVLLIALAVLLSILGYINKNSKSVIACGLFILGGLSLAACLVTFVSHLTELLIEVTKSDKEPHFVCRYGWSFYLANAALILTNIAGLFSILGYLNTFSNVDEMVRYMVPGGERKLIQQPYKCSSSRQKSCIRHSERCAELEPEAPFISNTPPDVCSTSHGLPLSTYTPICQPNVCQKQYRKLSGLAGQTVAITIRRQSSKTSLQTKLKYENVETKISEPEIPDFDAYYGIDDALQEFPSQQPKYMLSVKQ